MIHIIKNYKWAVATSLICIFFGLLTFFTFINQSFIESNESNLKKLLIVDLVLLILFFSLIISSTYVILKERREGKLGSETSLKYIVFFSTTTLLPSILIAVFSLFLFNVVLQNYFEREYALGSELGIAGYYSVGAPSWDVDFLKGEISDIPISHCATVI